MATARRPDSIQQALSKLHLVMALLMRLIPAPAARLATCLLLAMTLAPGLAQAQYIGAAPPPPPAATVGEGPAAALSRNLRLLALSPRNFEALIGAGRAALALGDSQAAVGFFGRAEEVRPSDPAPKVGMGAATIQMGQPREALSWFDQARQLGAPPALMGADRGLAHDLLGQQSVAQSEYRSALSSVDANEARRRLALSMAISGDARGGLATLQPLLNNRDAAAQRVRAFVLALGGDRAGASSAIEAAMPGSGARMDPFFRMLPSLSAEQKAAAVHLGIFPDPSEIRVAAVTPTIAPPVATPVASRPPMRTAKAAPKRVIVIDPTPRAATSLFNRNRATRTVVRSVPKASGPPAPEPDPARAPALAAATPPVFAPPITVAAVGPPAPSPVERIDLPPAASPSFETAAVDRLSGIDALLAETSEPAPPPASTPRVDPVAKKVPADKKKAADKKAAAEKILAEKKARAEKAALGASGSHWVQLAGGSHADRMASEYKRIKAKQPSLFKGHSGHVTAGKDYYRLLVGPFDDSSDARAFVNKLAKAGIDGFSWTRTPAQIKIEKLPAK